MAHVLFGNTTVIPIDPDTTAPFDSAALLNEQPTEETPAFACAYLIEARARLLAIRDTFEDARLVAQSFSHLEGVRIREIPLPCDASAFVASHHRTWVRTDAGGWTT